MNQRPRRRCGELKQADLPLTPGVYAFYRDGEAVYVGKAASLRARLWTNHLRRGASMTNSAFRRNVANELGIASAADIKSRRYVTTADDAARVSDWIGACELAWIECPTELEAVRGEAALKAELKPRLTRI
jgi:hypothetical protein